MYLISISIIQLESEFFLVLLFWMRTAACDDTGSIQASVSAFLFEISWNHFKHFPVSSRHIQHQDKDYSICPSQDYVKFSQSFLIISGRETLDFIVQEFENEYML